MSKDILRRAGAATLMLMCCSATVSAQATAPPQETRAGALPISRDPIPPPSSPIVPPVGDPPRAQPVTIQNEPSAPVGSLRNDAAGVPLEVLTDDFATPEAQSSGILGNFLWLDLVALFLTALLGAVVGSIFAGRQSYRSQLASDVRRLKEGLAHIEKGLQAQAKLSTGSGGSPIRQPGDSLRHEHRSLGTQGFAPSSSQSIPPADHRQDARAAEQETSRRLRQGVSDYCKLVATKGAKPRQFADALKAFPRVLAIQQQGNTMVSAPYRDGDANQFIVAVGEGDSFAVLPTYEYVSDFSMAFSKSVMNPEGVRQLFDLVGDESGQLQIALPAAVELDDTGVFHAVRKGQLSGFRS